MHQTDAEAQCLLGTDIPPLTRRMFAVTSLATGFALSTLPVSAQAITTPTDGLLTGEVKIPAGDGELPAYRAQPAGKGPFPVVLVVQEIFGVHEHIKDVCRRFAREGYLAIAPELYARQGNPAGISDIPTLIKDIVNKVPDAQVMADLDSTVAWAKANGGDTARLGVTGFCWGGRVTWLYATHNPAVKAGVAWYGRLVTPGTALQPMVPVDLVQKLNAPILGLYGGKDTGIPLEDVERMRTALKAAGKTSSDIHVYPDAPHGFYADYRSGYRPEEAADAWKRCIGWFKANKVG